MSSFKCPTCGTDNIDTPEGYVQGCGCASEPTMAEIQTAHIDDCWLSESQYEDGTHLHSIHTHRGILLKRLAVAEAKIQDVLECTNYDIYAEQYCEGVVIDEYPITPKHKFGVGDYARTDAILKIIGED